MLRFSLILLLLTSVLSTLQTQTRYALNGNVTNSTSGEAIIAVNIRIHGTSFGTVTNSMGQYNLGVEQGNQTIIFSSIGYQSETLRVNITANITHNVKLVESPVKIAEVVVSAEDPAIEIIRKAIANKRKWMDKLKTYSFDAFTRQVLRSDTGIASITESYSTAYMQVGDTLREVIKQKRQTLNMTSAENAAAVRGIINFNEDRISLFRIQVNDNSNAYTFVGPTAPDALEYYDYKLIGTSTINGVEIYKIAMTGKSRTTPLFNGTITIADETYAVMGVDVTPNETFAVPFIKDISLHYQQQFSLYSDIFWMPTDIRITGGFNVSFIGFTLPKIGIEQTSAIYNYNVNIAIPDSVMKKSTLVVDSTATKFDSTFWKQNDVLPLTSEEEKAYSTLDSTQTLEKKFEPKGPLASLGNNDAGSVLSYIDGRFNRVEGFYFGGKYKNDSLPYNLTIRTSLGYGFSDTLVGYNVGATIFTNAKRKIGLGFDVFQHVDNIPDEGYYGSLFNTLTSLIDKNDYNDYFLTKGWRAFTTFKPARSLSAEISYGVEKQSSMDNNTSYSLFAQSKIFRVNPIINDGTLHSIKLKVRIGAEPIPLGLISQNGLNFDIEHSSLSLTGGDFDFTRYHALVEWNINTFGRDLLFPPKLSIKLSAGTSSGTLPIQRSFSLDSRSSRYAPFGVLRGSGVKEFGGNRYVMLNLEHNFRSVPFLALNIPFLYKNSIELITFGSIAQTWTGTTSTSDGWYAEAGIGINRIFDIIRTDFTYRFTNPKQFYFTLSVANLF